MTRPYAEVIGDPIAQSKSPLIHNFWLEKLGIDAEYRAFHVQPRDLRDYFASRRRDSDWLGCNVTIPHKRAVFNYLGFGNRRVDEKGAGIGAVNTVHLGPKKGLRGTNTDVDGVGEAITEAALKGQHAVVLGAGGAARAAFSFLSNQNCASVRVLARNPDNAERATKACGLDANVVPFRNDTGAFSGASLLINATQLGMQNQDAMPEFVLHEISQMADRALVFDMVYSPLDTGLLKVARARGLRTSDGLKMLVGQAAVAFELFFDQPAARQHDAELRALLTA
jgi:shikimate dehydrogenase